MAVGDQRDHVGGRHVVEQDEIGAGVDDFVALPNGVDLDLVTMGAGDIDPRDFNGSWSGAFGHTQFMPSTFLGTAVDGEILPWLDGSPLPFAQLQRRIGRKTVGKTILAEVPVVLRVFDRELGGRLEQTFDFRHVWSTAVIAAPWFVGAALGS